MQLQSTTIYAHGSKLILVPRCREKGKPFSVYESVEVLSSGVSLATLGRTILSSLEKGRDDVASNSEGFDLDEFAKMFGERTIGALEKRSGKVNVSISSKDNKLHIYPWKRDGKQGWGPVPGVERIFELDVTPNDLAILCREYLAISVAESRD